MPRLSLLNDLPRRARLTIEHHGWREFVVRVLTFPLRAFGLERQLRERLWNRAAIRNARTWFRESGRSVTIVVPTYGPPATTIDAVGRLRKTVDPDRTRIVVVDDGSPAEDQAELRSLEGVELVLSPENAGFAASVNRGVAAGGDADDVVVLNNDVIPHRGWLELLQQAAYSVDDVGVAGPKLLYPDGRIQSAGSYRNLRSPEWFDHRYRFKPARFGPAQVPADALAMTGACLYVKRSVFDGLGPLDEEYGMGYEDVDYCLRAWEAGRRVVYEPQAVLTHLESTTRGPGSSERELEAQRRFWTKWGKWFDERSVRTPEGALRVIYITQGTDVGGGHRDVFEHLDRLSERGHSVELFTLDGEPDWFPLKAPLRTFASYAELTDALATEDAIKVATWWRTAPWVWRASVTRGAPVYFVQDIETSYYPRDESLQRRVLATYREEFAYMTISEWNRSRLDEMGLEAELVPPGIDLDTFRPLDVERRDDMLLAVGRAHHLKNLDLTLAAWRRLEPRPELWMFGVEPELGAEHGARYVEAPSDAEVNELLNQASVFVQTSRHEGFALPPLEAMAAGTPVVCTDAHGNRDFCRDGENCLLVEPSADAVAGAIARLLADRDLRDRLVAGGLRTAQEYRWERRIDELEKVFERIAGAAGPAGVRPAASSQR